MTHGVLVERQVGGAARELSAPPGYRPQSRNEPGGTVVIIAGRVRRRSAGRCLCLIAAVGALLTTATPGAASSASRLIGPFGSGDRSVWLVVPPPRAHPRLVVVFAHGWRSASGPPADWIVPYRPWLDHLVAKGAVVLFPRYQIGPSSAPDASRVAAFEAGVRIGFSHLHRTKSLPVVSVGYSFGGALAMTYTAWAGRWRLPEPVGVDSIFPARMIRGAFLPPPPDYVQALIQVGDRDTIAGTAGADQFWSWLAPVPQKQYMWVYSNGSFTADHLAPMTDTAGARQAFWQPLDHLIHLVRLDPGRTHLF